MINTSSMFSIMPDIGLLSHEKNNNSIYHLFGFGLDKNELNALSAKSSLFSSVAFAFRHYCC